MAKTLLPCIALAALFCFAQANPAHSGTAIKAKLYSPNASEEATGTLMLDGFNLSGHLRGGGIDVLVSGVVKSNSVDIEVTGHIVPSCSVNRQSMNGAGANEGAGTSITLDFSCATKGTGFFGGGQDYLFRLDLALPSPHLQIPAASGQNAESGMRWSGEIYGDPA
jgi:hypothetical protein